MRHWPEGFSFPACTQCNQATKHDEQKIAMLSRLSPDPESAEQEKEMRNVMAAVARNYPDMFREIRPSPQRVRQFFAKRGQRKPLDVLTSEVPVLFLGGPIVATAMEAFARKLLLGLHYTETGQIVSHSGGILWHWYTNVQAVENELPSATIRLFGGSRPLQRAQRNLREQFDYRFGIGPGEEFAGYFAWFRAAFAILGIVSKNEEHLPRPPETSSWKIIHPYSWPEGK